LNTPSRPSRPDDPAPRQREESRAPTVAEAGERAIIQLIRRRLPQPPAWVLTGIGDDAAVIRPARNTVDVLTADALVEGVHFDCRFTPPGSIGHRAMAANLSDLAAMGAQPRVALLSLALPGSWPVVDLEAMVDGLLALATAHGVHLVGGNITRSPGPLVIDVTACGAVHHRRVLRRSGARPGDEVWVSGTIGSAAAGLAWLAQSERPDPGADMQACTDAYLWPQPRVRLGLLLGRNRAATACVDLSDGLADGLTQLAAASGAGIEIDAAAVPVAPTARQWFESRGSDPVRAALGGGDDYELLFTVSGRRRSRFAAVRRLLGGLPVTRIGRVTADTNVRMSRGGSLEPVEGGYEHFR
jgi:thiamine-monophosphate kinase